MNEADRVRLKHMLAAAKEARIFAEGKSRESLNTDRGLALILIQEITIIGEAASKVSAECRAANPQIPWVLITGMRNRLIHAYFDINLDIIWNTAANRLPESIAELEKILSTEES